MVPSSYPGQVIPSIGCGGCEVGSHQHRASIILVISSGAAKITEARSPIIPARIIAGVNLLSFQRGSDRKNLVARPFTLHEIRIVLDRCARVAPVPFEGRSVSPGTALSLREPDAGSAAILGNEFHTGFSECGYERLAGFSATTNVSLGGLQSLYRRRGYPGACGQIILGPAEQRSRRFDLAY